MEALEGVVGEELPERGGGRRRYKAAVVGEENLSVTVPHLVAGCFQVPVMSEVVAGVGMT